MQFPCGVRHVSWKIQKDATHGVFWVVTPCSVMVGYRRFGGSCCLFSDPEDVTNQKTATWIRTKMINFIVAWQCFHWTISLTIGIIYVCIPSDRIDLSGQDNTQMNLLTPIAFMKTYKEPHGGGGHRQVYSLPWQWTSRDMKATLHSPIGLCI
jgi:hypothetical protein